jgi:YNFM family putative membrane transporter
MLEPRQQILAWDEAAPAAAVDPRPGVDKRKQRSVRLALSFAAIAVYADLYTTQPILPILSREFHVTASVAGLTISILVLMIALMSAPYGFLSDTLGRKPVMVWSCALLVIPTLLCAVAPTFKLLLAFRAVQGLLMPGVTAVAVAYLGDSYAEADLGPRVGGWIAASVAGGLTGRVFGGLLASWIHWRAPFVFFGLWTLVGAIALARTIPPRQKARTVRSGIAFRGMFGHFRNRRLVGSFIIGAGVFFATIGVFTYLPYYLSAPPFNLSTAVISSLYVVYIVGVLTSLVSGRIAQRVSVRTLMGIGLGISALGVIITGISLLPVVLLGLVVLCVGMFTVQGIAPTFVNRNASGAKGGAGALYVSFYYLGASVGSSLPGYAWQIWGWWGVVATCVGALCIALLADFILCR